MTSDSAGCRDSAGCSDFAGQYTVLPGYAMLGLGLEPENHTSEIYPPFTIILLYRNYLPNTRLRV